MSEIYKTNDFVQIRITPANQFIWDRSYHRYTSYKSGIFQILGYDSTTKLYMIHVREPDIIRWSIGEKELKSYGADRKWLGKFAFAVHEIAFGGKSKYECNCNTCEIYDVDMMKRYAQPKIVPIKPAILKGTI